MELEEMTPEQLYSFKDRLKRQRITGRGPEAAYRRWYKWDRLKCINAELRRRGLPATQPGDCRVYGPGGAPWQQAGAQAK